MQKKIAGYTLKEKCASYKDEIEYWKAERGEESAEVYLVSPTRRFVIENLPQGGVFASFSIVEFGARLAIIVPGQLQSTIRELRSNMGEELSSCFAWHVCSKVGNLHSNGRAHGCLHASQIGIDHRGEISVRPALASFIPSEPDEQASAIATDCWQLGFILEEAGISEQLDPRFSLVLSGLKQDYARLRLQPASAVRQSLTAVLARHGEWEEKMVSALGTRWRLEQSAKVEDAVIPHRLPTQRFTRNTDEASSELNLWGNLFEDAPTTENSFGQTLIREAFQTREMSGIELPHSDQILFEEEPEEFEETASLKFQLRVGAVSEKATILTVPPEEFSEEDTEDQDVQALQFSIGDDFPDTADELSSDDDANEEYQNTVLLIDDASEPSEPQKIIPAINLEESAVIVEDVSRQKADSDLRERNLGNAESLEEKGVESVEGDDLQKDSRTSQSASIEAIEENEESGVSRVVPIEEEQDPSATVFVDSEEERIDDVHISIDNVVDSTNDDSVVQEAEVLVQSIKEEELTDAEQDDLNVESASEEELISFEELEQTEALLPEEVERLSLNIIPEEQESVSDVKEDNNLLSAEPVSEKEELVIFSEEIDSEELQAEFENVEEHIEEEIVAEQELDETREDEATVIVPFSAISEEDDSDSDEYEYPPEVMKTIEEYDRDREQQGFMESLESTAALQVEHDALDVEEPLADIRLPSIEEVRQEGSIEGAMDALFADEPVASVSLTNSVSPSAEKEPRWADALGVIEEDDHENALGDEKYSEAVAEVFGSVDDMFDDDIRDRELVKMAEKGSPWGLVLVLGIIAVFGVVYFLNPTKEMPSPETKDVDATQTMGGVVVDEVVEFSTNPPGGTIYIDRKKQEVEPIMLTLEPEKQLYEVCVDWGTNPICRKISKKDLQGGYVFEQ